jgi:hypothetical protein
VIVSTVPTSSPVAGLKLSSALTGILRLAAGFFAAAFLEVLVGVAPLPAPLLPVLLLVELASIAWSSPRIARANDST